MMGFSFLSRRFGILLSISAIRSLNVFVPISIDAQRIYVLTYDPGQVIQFSIPDSQFPINTNALNNVSLRGAERLRGEAEANLEHAFLLLAADSANMEIPLRLI